MTRFKLQGALILAGTFAIIAGRAVHLVAMQDATEPQALLRLWPFWLGGVALVALGLLCERKSA